MVTSIPHIIAICAAFLATPDPTQESPTSLELDEPYRDRIALNDPPIVTPTLETLYVKAPTVGQRFTFEATETRRYEISLVSYLFDSYLTLRTSNGKLLAENDDGPISTHALLPFEATKGETYVIEAGALHGHAGPFELIVRHAQASAPAADFAWLMKQYVRDEHNRLRAYEIEYGTHHPGTALARVALGAAYFRTFQRHEAHAYFKSSLTDYELAFGPHHRNVATLLDNMALTLTDFGDYESAEDFHLRALAVLRALGPENLENLLLCQYNLGRTLLMAGKAAEALPFLEATVEGHRLRGTTGTGAGLSTLIALANAYVRLGNQASADRALATGQSIVSTLPFQVHFDPAVIGLRITEINSKVAADKLEEARKLASELARDLRVAPRFGLAVALSLLAYCCYLTGDLDLALEYQTQALALHDDQHGVGHPESMVIRQNRTKILIAQKKHEEALRNAEETLEKSLRYLDPLHPVALKSESDLGWVLCESNADPHRAVEVTAQELDKRRTKILSDLSALPNQERLLLAATHRRSLSRMIRLAIQLQSSDVLETTYGHALQWKGLVSRGIIQDRQWLRQQRTKLASAAQRGETDSITYAEYLQDRQPIDIRESLRRNEAYLDFLMYTDAGEEDTKLACFVSTSVGLSVVVLGDADEIARLVTFHTDALLQASDDLAVKASQALLERIWMPIEGALSGRTTLYISPDGAVSQLPFACVQRPDGSYLVEEYAFIHCEDVGNVRQSSNDAAQPSKVLLVGGVDYGAVPSDAVPLPDSAWRGYRTESLEAHQVRFPYLPATLSEVMTLKKLCEDYTVDAACVLLKSGQASEASLKAAAQGAEIIHVATHGFFSDRPSWMNTTPDTGGEMSIQEIKPSSGPAGSFLSPGLMSGLVLAGANHGRSSSANNRRNPGSDDGYLTAEEISWLDLGRCQLIVLSACDTGRGRSVPGEHLIGLRRSLRLAGAQHSITSLWRIDDEKTSDFMIEFYRNLWKGGLHIHEALRQAQLEILRKNRVAFNDGRPSSWGAFVLDSTW